MSKKARDRRAKERAMRRLREAMKPMVDWVFRPSPLFAALKGKIDDAPGGKIIMETFNWK